MRAQSLSSLFAPLPLLPSIRRNAGVRRTSRLGFTLLLASPLLRPSLALHPLCSQQQESLSPSLLRRTGAAPSPTKARTLTSTRGSSDSGRVRIGWRDGVRERGCSCSSCLELGLPSLPRKCGRRGGARKGDRGATGRPPPPLSLSRVDPPRRISPRPPRKKGGGAKEHTELANSGPRESASAALYPSSQRSSSLGAPASL